MAFPVTAIASIAHRICAVIVWLGWGFLLVAAAIALESPAGFAAVADALDRHFAVQFVAWGLGSATGYYAFASLKHLLQDLGFFEDLAGGRAISWAVLILGAVSSLILGVWLWG